MDRIKLYSTHHGILLERDGNFYSLKHSTWDDLVNRPGLFEFLDQIQSGMMPIAESDEQKLNLLPPIGSQEVWAAGVTYLRSKTARMEESEKSHGEIFYDKVYEAERPELFFKSTANRVVGPEGKVHIRKDSTWDVPEPELTLFISSEGTIEGYTIGNDMSSRSIEGENPLYLPQAKVYDRSAAIGPCLLVTDSPLPGDTTIHLEIHRSGSPVFQGSAQINQIKRKLEELVHYLYLEMSFPNGCYLMTGTGIVPPKDFTLQERDLVSIEIDSIGKLVNTINRRS